MSDYFSNAALSIGAVTDKIPWSSISWILVVAVIVAIIVNICVPYNVF
jgi:hypothetical protein